MVNEYGINKDWKSWKRMTQSDFYCGMHRGVQDFCPAYVTPEEFLKFQERDVVKGTPSGAIYFFRSMMRCPECGHKLCGDVDRRYGRVNKSYRCAFRGRGCSNHKAVPEKKTEKQLLKDLEIWVRNTIAEVEIEANKPSNKNGSEKKIKNLKEQLRRLNIVYMAGNKSDEDYFKEDAEIKLAISKAEKELEISRPRKVDHLKELLETDFRTTYATLTEDEKQEFWQDLVKELKIDHDKKITEVIFFT
jgi:hypothetical protein